jgi:hypothetical protein
MGWASGLEPSPFGGFLRWRFRLLQETGVVTLSLKASVSKELETKSTNNQESRNGRKKAIFG